MAIEILTDAEALRIARENPYAKYPKPKAGSERLFPLPNPECSPSFQIGEGAKIFTIGSCFAREVDRALNQAGFNVISRNAELSDAVERAGQDESLYNKYTIHSILNEIRWALDPHNPYPGQRALIETGDGNWVDPQLGGSSFGAKLEDMLTFRESYTAAMKRIAEADVIIITLGLVEAWFDTFSHLYLNAAPPLRGVKKTAGRFQLHVIDYNEIIQVLEEINVLITRYGKKEANFLITVSPVPLLTTFRSQDVLLANSYSKSVQRAAVEKFVLDHENVNYFPSYEFVTLGNPNSNWAHDYRHVNPSVVNRIMASVMKRYATDAWERFNSFASEIGILYKDGAYKEIIRRAEQLDVRALDISTIYRVGLSFKKIGQFGTALRYFSICLENDPSYRPALENAIAMASKTNQNDLLQDYLHQHEARFPDESGLRARFKHDGAIKVGTS